MKIIIKLQEHQEKKKQIDYLKNQIDREKEECSRLRRELQVLMWWSFMLP